MQPVGKKYHIVSWNCQGNSIERVGASQSWIDSSAQNLLLIQELGNPKDWDGRIKEGYIQYGSGRYPYIFKPHFAIPKYVGNIRCSLGMLMPDDCVGKTIIMRPRPCLYTIVQGDRYKVLVATMHATSDGGHSTSQGEIELLIQMFNKKEKSLGDYDEWILMGDFNNEPSQIPKRIKDQCHMICPDKCTHGVKVLDYAFYSSEKIIIKEIKIIGITGSDHVPVALDIII